jgi:hypothetical protein
MEEVGLDKIGCGVMSEVGDCSNASKCHDILAMETFTCFVQQPPSSPFSFKDLSWWVELR